MPADAMGPNPIRSTSAPGDACTAAEPDTAFIRGRMVEHSPAPARRPPRIAVIGAGAVGGYLAARAAGVGAEVVLGVRRPFERLRIVRSGPDGDDVVTEVRVRVLTDPADLDGPVDWVILATKAQQTPAALPWLTAALGDATGVVVAQNGVRHAERVSPPVPVDAVLPTVVYINAELLSPGLVRHRAYGVIQAPDSALGARFAATALPAGDVRLIADFASAAWTKLVVNSAVNSLTALTGRRIEVMNRDDVAEVALAVMREAVAVARAEGARIPDDLPESTLGRLRSLPPGAGTSMLYDRMAGRSLEHDALIGDVVRIGAERSVPTPTACTLLPLLAAISDAAG